MSRFQFALVITCSLFSVTTLAQNYKNPFSELKSKKKLPVTTSTEETVIDGSLNRNDIFQSTPLFKLSKDNHHTIFAPGNSSPVWIKTRNAPSAGARMDSRIADPKTISVQYLTSVSKIIRINDPAKEFDVISSNNSHGKLHVKLQQKYNEVPIEGNQIALHFTGAETILNGRYIPTPFLYNTTPVVSEASSVASAIGDLKKGNRYRELTSFEKELLDYEGPESALVFYRKAITSDNIVLAWKVNIRPNPLDHWIYFVDASNGQILYKQNHTCSAGPTVSTATDLNGKVQTFSTYNYGGKYYMIDASKSMFKPQVSNMPDDPEGAIWTIDANNTDLTTFNQITSNSPNTWDPKAVSAHRNADSCYNYYKKVLNRISLDGDSGTIISVINVTDGGQPMDNAYWNGKFMAYGNGDQVFKPLAGGLDVAAHEMTHGVIQHEANLNYQGQSGAINESFADIFGVMVDRDDWHVGEDVMLNNQLANALFPTGYLRDLADPHNGGASKNDASWQPMHMNEFVNTFDDNGGVHTNSGIPNHAFYLFATSAGVDKSIAEQVYYKALKDYLVASSQFIDLRLAIIQAATELYPNNPTIASAAGAAFDAVGIINGTPTHSQTDLPVNPGAESVLVEGLDSDNYSLYKINVSTLSGPAISTRRLGNKPSVTDNGGFAFFVDDQGRIIRKSLITNAEVIVDQTRIWDNVAVSKDGLRLAAVSDEVDSSIYVGPASGGSWKRFKLYKPTYSDSIFSSGPQYADALEWDYTGEKVMFDCYNLTKSSTDTIDYWTIGFINVWNNATNSYGDGRVRNLFDGLPEYISIGNPTFSKNSPYIIAFDYLDFENQEILVLGTNIETGDVGAMAYNYMLGFPSYSKYDDKVAFTSRLDLNNDGVLNEDTAVFYVNLSPDKINADPQSNNLGVIATDCKIPVWYAAGTRVLSNQQATSTVANLNAYPNPFTDEINLDFTMTEDGTVSIEILDMVGRQVKELHPGPEGPGLHNYKLSLSELENGTYIIKVKAGENAGVVKIVKTK